MALPLEAASPAPVGAVLLQPGTAERAVLGDLRAASPGPLGAVHRDHGTAERAASVDLRAASPAPVRAVLRDPGTEVRAASTDLCAGAGAGSLERGAAPDHRVHSLKRPAPANRARERVVRRRRDGDQTLRRLRDNLSVGNSVLGRVPNYEPDNEMSYIDSLSSSDKENVNPMRKRFLDDALFEFVRKEAVKSVRSEFSKFIRESDVFSKTRVENELVLNRCDFSSYSIKYFWEVLKSMSDRHKEVIRNFGFSCLLFFQKCDIPSAFVRWIASCVDTVSSQILVDDCKIIPISKESVYYVTGLPKSGSVPMPECERGAKFILSFFGLTELPRITFFGNKLKSNEVMSDKEIFVCFIVVAFKCFLFPSSDEYPNTDFLHILEEPDTASSVDICSLVYEHFMSGVSKFSRICNLNGRKPKEFEFCHYMLAVYYLDSLDFGARIVDQSVPRISVWHGNMIKLFSDLDHKKKKKLGRGS